MKKTTKNIIITLAVLIVLSVAVAVLVLTKPADTDQEDSTSSSSSVETLDMLVDKEITQIQSVVITNNETKESMTLIPTKKDKDSEANDTFTIEGWEKEPVLTENVKALAHKFYSITPSKEIGEVENLAEYGLSGDGAFKVIVNCTDGSAETLIIGIEAGETYGRYMLYNGQVYIIPVSSDLENDKTSFIDKEVYAIADRTKKDAEGNDVPDTPELQSLKLSGTNYPQEIHLGAVEDDLLTYAITEPIFSGVNSIRAEDLLKQLQKITASGVLAVQATEEQIAECGLDNPTNIAEYELNNEKHTIRLGTLKNGIYSMMVDDQKIIYQIEEVNVNAWAGSSLFEFRDGFICLANIKNVKTLTIEAADGTDSYNVTRVLNEERSTEEAPFYDLEIEKDGKEIAYENYQPFYQKLLSVYLLNEEIREPEGKPVLTIRYEYFEGGQDEISFYEDTAAERRYIVTLNGEPNGVVRASNVDNILEAKPIIAQNKPVEEEKEE